MHSLHAALNCLMFSVCVNSVKPLACHTAHQQQPSSPHGSNHSPCTAPELSSVCRDFLVACGEYVGPPHTQKASFLAWRWREIYFYLHLLGNGLPLRQNTLVFVHASMFHHAVISSTARLTTQSAITWYFIATTYSSAPDDAFHNTHMWYTHTTT